MSRFILRSLHVEARAEEICAAYGVSLDDVLATSAERPRARSPRVTKARDHLAYVLKDELGLSYPEAGIAMRRDHTTVMQAVRRFALAAGDVKYARPRHVKRLDLPAERKGAA